jgi:hypothetical protein
MDFTKSFEGREKLLVLMENTWGLHEDEAVRRIFEALYSLAYYFREYVKQYRINEPSEIIKVEYLKRGAFIRYSMKELDKAFQWGRSSPRR